MGNNFFNSTLSCCLIVLIIHATADRLRDANTERRTVEFHNVDLCVIEMKKILRADHIIARAVRHDGAVLIMMTRSAIQRACSGE